MDKEVRQFPGYEARHNLMNNAIKIELGQSFNGSGPKAFGGAREWPCLRVEVAFEEGEEEKMAIVASGIETLLREAGLIIDKFNNIGSPPYYGRRCSSCNCGIIYGAICSDCVALRPQDCKQAKTCVRKCAMLAGKPVWLCPADAHQVEGWIPCEEFDE